MVGMEKALRRLWTGRCTITVRREKTDPVNRRTAFEEVTLYQDIPCRLSFSRATAHAPAEVSGIASPVTQMVKLFLPADIDVPPGSKITVVQSGRTTVYEQSGQPAVYTHHQEITLTLFRGWA